jgi:hypothetical protein
MTITTAPQCNIIFQLCNETFRKYTTTQQEHHHTDVKKVQDFICHCSEILHSKKPE